LRLPGGLPQHNRVARTTVNHSISRLPANIAFARNLTKPQVFREIRVRRDRAKKPGANTNVLPARPNMEAAIPPLSRQRSPSTGI
jgi:hypothetical protein